MLIRRSAAQSPEAYYSAKALTHIISMVVDAQGWQLEGADDWLTKVDILKPSTTNYLGAIAIVNGIGEDLDTSKSINNLCNRLISDVAGASAQSEKTLPLLVFLNSVLGIYAEGDLPVAQNRIVFAVKQMLGWASDSSAMDPQLASETCHALHKLLPAMKAVYGSYWEDSLRFCISIWESCSSGKLSDDSIPMIGMSLKFYHILKNLTETNDDLEEALVEFKDQIARALVGLLKLRRSKENEPLEFVDGLIARLVLKTPTKAIGELSELYPLVASEFKIVQATAHDLVASALPEIQRELSVTVLLDNTGKVNLSFSCFTRPNIKQMHAYPKNYYRSCWMLQMHSIWPTVSSLAFHLIFVAIFSHGTSSSPPTRQHHTRFEMIILKF
jgi:hypothetical protein